MAIVNVTIAHDIHGNIVSISRAGKGVSGRNIGAIVSVKDGQSVFNADVEEENIDNLIHTSRVDIRKKSIVSF